MRWWNSSELALEREALDAPLLDAVFAIISYNSFYRLFGPHPQPLPIDLGLLRGRFPKARSATPVVK